MKTGYLDGGHPTVSVRHPPGDLTSQPGLTHRDRRIAVQVDILLPPDRPGFLEAHASHQAHNDVSMHQRGRTSRILQPSTQLQCRQCLPSAHGAPWWSTGMLPWPLGTPSPSGSMHRWFPAVVIESPINVSKGHLAAKTWWAQLGSNQ
jgi:hypothetical protein